MKEIVKALAQLVRCLAVDRMVEVRRMHHTSMHIQEKAKYKMQETELAELVRRLHFAELTEEDRVKGTITEKLGGTD